MKDNKCQIVINIHFKECHDDTQKHGMCSVYTHTHIYLYTHMQIDLKLKWCWNLSAEGAILLYEIAIRIEGDLFQITIAFFQKACTKSGQTFFKEYYVL